MRTLSIDLETYSSVDLKTAGVHKYVASPDFQILMIAYAFDDDPVQIIDIMSNKYWNLYHEEFYYAIEDPDIIKTAYNATFEILCLNKGLGLNLDYAQWDCTMVRAAMLGLPTGLFATGIAIGLDTTKDINGKELIKIFCIPDKKTGYRILHVDQPEKWFHFLEYCKGDVIQERKIKERLNWFKIPEDEKRIWKLDAKINEAGIEVDPVLVKNAIAIAAEYENKCMAQAIELTALVNPKSTTQVKKWLSVAIGQEIESLNKKAMPEVLAACIGQEIVLEVLHLRGELSKTSVKKYDAMLRCIGSDNRARGLLQYYGAARTARWAGRLIQVQNLKRNSMEQLDLARNLVKAGDLEAIELLWLSPPEVLSQLVRTAFVAPKGKVFISSDFSAIEARITAWLAREQWRIDVFNSHGKIYEASAAMMFKIPIEEVTKNSPARYKAKCAELALGFGGGPPALINIGALGMGMIESELPDIVRKWRNVNKKIFTYWYDTYDKAVEAIENPGQRVPDLFGISYIVQDKRLWITLPSGRQLVYLNPKMVPGKFDRMQIGYMGVDQFTKKFTQQMTYGGKLVENIVQATARDVLAYAMLDLDKAGYKIVCHVHDEVIMEVDENKVASATLDINRIMSQGFSWSKGLPLGADSSVFKYYKKD